MNTMKVAIFAIVAATTALFGGPKSGPEVGAMVFAFEPTHVTGPDAGTDTCPVCKYGNTPAVQVWVHGDSASNVAKIVKVLEAKTAANPAGLKAFVVEVIDKSATKTTEKQLKGLAKSAAAKHVALTYVAKDNSAVSDYEINLGTQVKNTVFVYRNRKVIAKWVNLTADAKGTAALDAAVTKATK